MKCPKCKKKINDKAVFCGYCGAMVRESTEQRKEKRQSDHRKSNFLKIFAYEFVIILLVGCIGKFLYVKGIIKSSVNLSFWEKQQENMVTQNVETNEYLSNDLITDTEIEESETEDEQIDTDINTTEELQTDNINSGTEDTDLTEKKHYAWRASNVLVVIDDKAKVLNEEAIDNILNITFSVAEKTNESIMVVTTNDTFGKSSQEFADEYFDNVLYTHTSDEGLGEDGYLFLINLQDRECYISTAGRLVWDYSDEILNENLDIIYPYMVTGDYETAIIKLVESTPYEEY